MKIEIPTEISLMQLSIVTVRVEEWQLLHLTVQITHNLNSTRVCAVCVKAKNTYGIKPLVYTCVHTSKSV